MALPLLKSFDLFQNQWKSILDPIVANPIIQGVAITSIQLDANTPKSIPTTLSRVQQGWFLTDLLSEATVWRTQPFNSTTLTLQSNADTTINIWVF